MDAVKAIAALQVLLSAHGAAAAFPADRLVFSVLMVLLTFAAMGLAAWRSVPLKMLPFDNKNELLLVLDFDEGHDARTHRCGSARLRSYLAGVPEVTDFTSYVGVASPMDFNGLVRHYYLRQGDMWRKFESTWLARKIVRCKVTPSDCGCAMSLQADRRARTRRA